MRDNPIKIFVTDTGPLITLSVADSLDYLKFPRCPVYIPDAVFFEASRDTGRLGAQELIDWVNNNEDVARIVPTQEYKIFNAAREADPSIKRVAGLGERAAVEVLSRPDKLKDDERGILLCEESQIGNRIRIADTEKIIPISTMDFLTVLERRRLIQSSDHVFWVAREKGRYPSTKTYLEDHDPGIRDAVHDILRRAHTKPEIS